MRPLTEIGGRRLPFLRWSVLRLAFGMRTLLRDWQVGDGREEALAQHVLAHARRGDLDDVIRAIDDFSVHRSFLINIGDEKGEILDAAVRKVAPKRLLELGAYCGYSALRMVRVMPADAHLFSVEFNAANAGVARRVWDHAGVGDRITVLVGSLGDGRQTLGALRSEHGFADGSLDFVFVDHDKSQYLPDLQRILDERWLHQGSIVVADNIKFPGAPDYRRYMREAEGRTWRSIEHDTHGEYQSLFKDLVLESAFLGDLG